MKFGRLDDLSSVDFSLPPDAPGTANLLRTLPSVKNTELYVGCTGWSMKEWIGKTYPKGAKTGDFLYHYGRQFNTIELNTTHYRIPDLATVRKWYAAVPPDFRFCPKIPQVISHRRDMGLTDGTLQTFCDAIVGLEEKIGCCFMQMPPYFAKSDLPRLRLFLQQFPADIPLAVEVRHETFFQNPADAEPLARLLESQGRAFVITDVAGRRDVLHNRLTNAVAMIRWNGNGLIPSDYARLDAWAIRLEKWSQNGIAEVYFFTHEPDNILAPEATDYLVEKIKTEKIGEVRGPNFFDENAGKQISLF